jgi:Family of unknown function (DUF5675)
MELYLKRGVPIGLALPGELGIDSVGQHACYTLENAEDAIPVGRYRITLYMSPKFNCLMPLLNDVPGRSYIEIHWGTYPQNYAGCIGVGEFQDLATGEIFNTHLMWNKLYPAIDAAVDSGEGCFITIS